MGNFYLRMPKSKTQPESWRLISSQLQGPYADGQLKLGTYQGWAAHCAKQAPDAELFQFRDRDGKNWLPACYMSTAKNFQTILFPNMTEIVNVAGYRPDTGEVVNYIVPLGWAVTRETVYGFYDFYFTPDGIVSGESKFREDDLATAWGMAGATVPFYRDNSQANGGLSALSQSWMGWTGNEAGTIIRYRNEVQGWYSVPIGAAIEQAETMREIQRINGIEWAQTAQLFRAEVDFELSGWSVDKSQLPWMNNYYNPSTTNALYPGVGAIRLLGKQPEVVSDPDDIIQYSNLVTYKLTGTIPNVSSAPFSAGLFTSPAVRDRPYGREDGELIWAGSLNDLGHIDRHGLPNKAPLVVTQIFNILDYDARDSFTYQIHLSDLPDPDPYSLYYYRTLENSMSVTATVRVIYAF